MHPENQVGAVHGFAVEISIKLHGAAARPLPRAAVIELVGMELPFLRVAIRPRLQLRREPQPLGRFFGGYALKIAASLVRIIAHRTRRFGRLGVARSRWADDAVGLEVHQTALPVAVCPAS